jgi:hypothetical protein
MAHASNQTDVNALPDLARLAHDVAASGEQQVLTENGAALAVVSPAVPRRRRAARPRPLTHDNPIWEIVGAISADVGSDVSANVDRYLAEAYSAESR